MNVDKILANMSLKDKVALGSGKSFWYTKDMPQYDIPDLMLADGPHGLRKQENTADMLGLNESLPATSFPTASISACSWDEKLLKQMGAAIATEAHAHHVGVVLGPGANIKRNPLCGRNFEYFSEDPYLTGKMAAAFIRGIEDKGIGSSLKHFALNSQEYKRFSSDSIVDERTMRELYLPGFEIAVKEGKPSTIMCAYNKLNGEYCSGNRWLLTDVLRKDWGFNGLVVTDWGAMNNRIKAYAAGCDLCMPGGSGFGETECVEAVKNGTLSEEYINTSAKRLLTLVDHCSKTLADTYEVNMQDHYELARKIAEESAVLLKNEDSILPLKDTADIAFIGHMAKKLRYQGSGSSHINPWKLTSVTDCCPSIPFAQGCNSDGSTSDSLLKEAQKLASSKHTVVLFVGLSDNYESEGFDRPNMKMPEGHLQLIQTVTAANPNTIIVLMSGSAVEIPWLHQVKGLLYVGLAGEAGGEAITNLLFGKAVPCGRLAETWPIQYEDCVSASYYNGTRKDAHYRESLYVGYRYYETADIPVRFPFGYGLSYTTFAYSDLQIAGKTASCTVKNVGNTTAKEIVQLYIEAPNKAIYRPKRELKAFTKVALAPGESKTIHFTLSERSFAIWDSGWKIPKGTYRICIGQNSHDMILTTEFIIDDIATVSCSEQITAHNIPVIVSDASGVPAWYQNPIGAPTQEDFEQLLGRKITETTYRKGTFTMENTVSEMKDDSLIMKTLYKILEIVMARRFGGKIDYTNPSFRMMMSSATDGSLSSMRISAGIKNHLLEGMLEMVNGHFFKGIITMFKKC